MVRRGMGWVVLVVILAGFAWWVSRAGLGGPALEARRGGAASSEGISEGGARPDSSGAEPMGATLSVADQGGTRLTAEGPLLVGSVFAGERPLDGIGVSWTALSPGFDEEQFEWRPGSRSLVSGASVRVLSQGGRFAFAEAPVGLGAESVLWATGLGYRAASVDRDGDESGVEFELVPAEPMRVAVLDGEDRPLAEAVVVLRALPDEVSAVGRGPNALRESRSRRALLRAFVTNEDGAVLLPNVPGRVMVTAEVGTSGSAPYIGEFAPDIVLRVGASFSAGGRVTLEGATDVLASDVWVECAGARGFQLEHVARVALRDDRSWAMETVPWKRWDQLVFRLHGGLLSNREVAVTPPEAGEHVRLDFEDVGMGGIFRARVVDESGEPIPGANAYSSAQHPGGVWHGRSAKTDETGLATIPGSGPGEVWVQVEAAGFVGATCGPFAVEPGREYGAVVVTLTAAARVAGHCKFAGEPVETFDILYWTDSPQNYEIQPFHGRSDGSFELDKAPTGTLFLRAQSAGLASSESIVVEVAPGAATEVELVLRAPARARGRVVAADTGEGISDASLAVFDRERRRTLTQLGPTVETALDGSFELHSLNPGENGVLVRAEGHAKRFLLVHGDPDTPTELGAVALEPQGRLRVHLTSTTSIDFSTFAFSAVGDETTLDLRPFPRSGLLELADIAPGTWRLVVHHPSGGWIQRSGALSPGRDWNVTFDVSEERRLHVAVEPDVQGRVPEDLIVTTSYRESDETIRTASLRVPAAGAVTFEGLPDQDLLLSLRDANGKTLDTRDIRWEEAREQTVRLDPRAPAASVRVLDAAGAPIAGVQVVAMAADSAKRWSCAADTDSDGWVALGTGELRRLMVVLSHPSLGTRLGRPLDLEGSNEVVMTVRGGLRVRLLDGATPCASVDVDVWDAASSFWVGRFATDGDGQLRIDKLEGRVGLDVQASGLWSTRAVVATQESGPPIEVQVLRTGGVELEARTTEGLPVAGARVELHCLDLDQSVASWIADGRLGLSGELVTDSSGRLAIRRIPRGSYAWRVVVPQRTETSGTVLVTPQGSAVVEAILDP